MNKKIAFLSSLSAAALCASAQGVVLQTWDFEGPNGEMDGANAGFGQTWTTSGTVFQNGALAVPVTLPNQSGTYAIRTFQFNTGAPAYGVSGGSDAYLGTATTAGFVMPVNGMLSYLIAGRASAATGVSFSVEEFDAVTSTWNAVHTATLNSDAQSNTFQSRNWNGSAFAGSTVRLSIIDNGTAGWDWIGVDNIVLNGDAIPEPSSTLLIALGTVGLLSKRRRKS